MKLFSASSGGTEGVLDLLVVASGEAPLLVRSTWSGGGRGCLSGSGDVAVEERREDPREEVGRGILDPGGLVKVRLTNTGDKPFSPPVATDT